MEDCSPPRPLNASGILNYAEQLDRVYRSGKGFPFVEMLLVSQKEECAMGTVYLRLLWVAIPWATAASAAATEQTLEPPYPPSPVIAGVEWDFEHLVRLAPGSDLSPVTRADDGHLYASWGDGGGFGGTNSEGRVGLGFARIEGTPPDIQGINVWGGRNAQVVTTFPGKCNGILCIGGDLYAHVVEQGRWLRARIARSADHGRTWAFDSSTGWDFAEPDGVYRVRFVPDALDCVGRDR